MLNRKLNVQESDQQRKHYSTTLAKYKTLCPCENEALPLYKGSRALLQNELLPVMFQRTR